MQSTWLQREYHLPKFSSIPVFRFVGLLILPNVLFWVLNFYFGTSRPILNTDYFIATLFLLIPNRFFKYVGILVYFACSIFDGLSFAIQIFPFLDVSAIRYLLPFALLAPTRYLILSAFLCLAMIITSIVMFRLSNKQKARYGVLSLLLISILAYGLKDIKYANYPGGILGRNNYFLVNSQGYLYHNATGSSFAKLMQSTPQITAYPTQKERAATHLRQPYTNKILYIVSESWGYPRTVQAQKNMLEKIASIPNLEYLEEGYFDFAGSTVQGEMRELCNFNISNGYAFKQIDSSKFLNCIPNQLKQMNYYTYAMHGSSSQLYDRNDWYPKAGFQNTFFGENFPDLKRCMAFNGVCDTELFNTVAETFYKRQNDNIFFYWLTLTSHAPYSKQDIINHRFICQNFGMDSEGDICRNAQLQTQFLDELAILMSMPQMKGVEVIVVGDHMPPVLTNEPIQPFLRWQDVSWLHFKVKN